MPPANPDVDDAIEFEMWKLDIKEFRAKEQACTDFKSGLYNVVMGQCTDALQDWLKSHLEFAWIYHNGIGLLILSKALTHAFEDQRYLDDAILDIKEPFYTFKQGRNMSLQ